MLVNHLVGRPFEPQGGEGRLLTANIVMQATGETAEGSANFGHLLLTLSTLALARFGAAPEIRCQDALPKGAPSGLVGTPADPFDGQLLRFHQADSGIQLRSIGPDLKDEI